MAFTDPQLVDIRRFCGYPAYANFGWVFSEQYAILTMRIGSTPADGNMSADEQAAVVVKLTNLYTLETAISTASNNLDTASAGPWVHNPNEIADRVRLFTYWRVDLCRFIGVQPGPAIGSGNTVVRT
ncbi:MAG: hypothetical protein B7Z80_10305 [Rhodospirillales bacterium 20-64-7]|nr:MAG: hypothetical protein B7Z80_10305 [Rhodospirillales bacterium 20-64-7]